MALLVKRLPQGILNPEMKILSFLTLTPLTVLNVFGSLSTGIDSEGHAANFVETEQIVMYEGAMASFVQASVLVILFDLYIFAPGSFYMCAAFCSKV